MSSAFASGRIADVVIGFMLIELIVLIALHRVGGRGLPIGELGASLAAGMALVFALRSALVGSSWQLIALWLGVALASHLVYVKLCFRAGRRS